MKLVLAVLLGLLLVAQQVVADGDDSDDEHGGSYHHEKCGHTVYTCVKSEEHCWKEEVCEEVEKVACGDDWCAYPEVCKYDTKKKCRNVTKYKKDCAAPKHTCVAELTDCGDYKCKYGEECKATEVCDVVKEKFTGYSGPASASASASAVSKGGHASASASAVSVSKGSTYTEPVKVCHTEYACIPKDPCETVYEEKCVHAELDEGKVYDEKTFKWMEAWEVGQECGKGYCKDGYKCAVVAKKVCPKGVECGEKICEPGYKCALEEVHCKEVPYTTPICEDVKYGKCYKPHDWVDYKPACRTELKCKEVECGGRYCEAGTACYEDYVPCKVQPKPKKRYSGDDDDGGDD